MPDAPWGIPDAAAVPVPDAGNDTLRTGLAWAMRGTVDGDLLDPSSEIPIGEAERLAYEFVRDHIAAAVQTERERATRERDNARAQIHYMCSEVAEATGIRVDSPSEAVDSVRALKTMADDRYGQRDRAEAAEAAIKRVRSLVRDWDQAHDWSDGHCHEGYRIPNHDDCDSDCLHCAAASVRWMLDHAEEATS